MLLLQYVLLLCRLRDDPFLGYSGLKLAEAPPSSPISAGWGGGGKGRLLLQLGWGGGQVALPAKACRNSHEHAVPDFALLYILWKFSLNSLGYLSNYSFSCFVTYYELRRTSLATMAEHNVVVFAGDHCGPEVTDYPRAFPPLTRHGEGLTVVI
jgi:hypothetical protein